MTTLDDAVAEARERLGASLRVMTGASARLIPVVGAVLSRGQADEDVVRELSNLAARMALDPSGFYDATSQVVESTVQSLTSTLRALNQITDGPNSMLEWSRDSRAPRQRVEELDDLLAAIQRARFARSEVTEVVRSELLALARAAADELAARLRAERAAELPTRSQLQLLVDLVTEVILDVNTLIGLRALFEAQRFEELALFRVLEAAEGELSVISGLVSGDIRDLSHEAGAVAVTTALETALSALTFRDNTFGDLSILEATISPTDVNLSATLTLSPVPEEARAGLVLPGTVSAHPDDSSKRLLTFVPSGDWNDSSDVEHDITVAYDEQLFLFGIAEGIDPVVASGVGSIAGEPQFGTLLDPGSITAEVEVFPNWGALPDPAAEPEKLAYVTAGSKTDIWYSDGESWDKVESDVDPQGGRFFFASGFPLGNEASPGDQMSLVKTAGSGPATWAYTVGAVASGRSSASSQVGDAFGVLLDSFVTNYTDWEMQWSLLDGGLIAAGQTDRVSLPSSAWATVVPLQFLAGRVATLWVSGSGWTHRVIDRVEEATDGLELVFSKPIPRASTHVYLPKLSDLPYPSSHFVRVAADYVDLRPGDVIVAQVGDEVAVRSVLHAIGDQAVLQRPLHTYQAFAEEAGEFSPDTSPAMQPATDPLIFASARRFRHMAVGDRVVALPSLPTTPGSGVEPEEGESYVIAGFRLDGIEVLPQSVESPDALPREYKRLVILPLAVGTTTDLFLAADETGATVLADLERTARRQKMADDPDAELDDTWPLREITFMLGGRPVDASRAWDNLVRLAERKPVWTQPFSTEVRARLEADGRRATLTVDDDALREVYTLATPPLVPPRVPLGSTALSDLETGLQYRVRSGVLNPPVGPPDPVPPVDILLEEEAVGDRSGPVTFGGPWEYGFWEWAMQKLRRVDRPDIDEFTEDLGRALADLGETKTAAYTGTYLAVEDVDTATVVVTFVAPEVPPPTAGILEGADFDDGVDATPPIRIVSVADPDEPSPASVTMTLTTLPTVAPGGVVNLRGTIVAQAWREVRRVVTYLDEVASILGRIRPAREQTVSSTAERLEVQGYRQAAEAVRTADFSKWTDIVGLSVRGELADRMEALVSSILSRRRSPLDT